MLADELSAILVVAGGGGEGWRGGGKARGMLADELSAILEVAGGGGIVKTRCSIVSWSSFKQQESCILCAD